MASDYQFATHSFEPTDKRLYKIVELADESDHFEISGISPLEGSISLSGDSSLVDQFLDVANSWQP